MKNSELFTKDFFSFIRRWKYVIIFLFIVLPVTAQNSGVQNVSGIVTDRSSGIPLIGVSVAVKGTSQGVITDGSGNYTIDVEKGKTLVFSYISYNTQEIQVNKPILDVSLEEDEKMLSEVVVVGYGVMKRSDITGAVGSITAEDISKSVNTTIEQALQGRLAGVAVTQNSGVPGGGISVSIRGTNSLNGNEPLYVIDGIAIEGKTDKNISVLSSIDPSDIASVDILKDASATAIYGTRASNGVVMITTKRGQMGKTKVTYDGYWGIQQLPKKLDVLNLSEYAVYQNLRADVIGFGAREEFADPGLLGEGTDWQDEIFRLAPMYNQQLTVSGGTEAGRYAVTGGVFSQDGIATGSGFDRYSMRINLDTKVTNWFSMGVSSYGARTKQENTIDNGDIVSLAIKQLPEVPARNPDGSWGSQEENMYGTYFANPLAEALMRENYQKGTQLSANVFADITPFKGLVFRVEGYGNFNYNNSYQFTPSYDYGKYIQPTSGSRSANNSASTSFKTYATYSNKFKELHNFSLMVGFEALENHWEYLTGSRSNYFLNSVHELDAGDSKTAKNGSSRGSSALESFYGRLNYAFNDRYLLTTTLRRDGSSTFGSNNKWGTFPSFALAWRINKEQFMEDVKTIDNLKLRLGWGKVGNQWAGSNAYEVTMATAASIWGTGFYPGNYPNPDLQWEKTDSYNIGIDLNMFNSRLEFIVDGYIKNIDNLLMRAELPGYISGLISAPWVNDPTMVNKGMEFTLNTININTKGFFWETGLTFSFNRNKVTGLYTETSNVLGEIGAETFTYTQVGKPIGQFYGYKVIGMFKDESDFYKKDNQGNFILDENGNKVQIAIPKDKTIDVNGVWVGDFIFEDKNGDGKIDEEDRDFIGNPEPKFVFGFNNFLSYKGFDFNIFLNGVFGNKIYNQLRKDFTNPMKNSGLLKETTQLAVIEKIDPNGSDQDISNVRVANPGAKVQRITVVDANDNSRMSDRFVEDGSYLRIKNVSLGYTLPKNLLSKFQIETIRVYANVQNLYTFTKYTGYDPEIGAYHQNVTTRGIDYARYPSQRIYTFGLNLTF